MKTRFRVLLPSCIRTPKSAFCIGNLNTLIAIARNNTLSICELLLPFLAKCLPFALHFVFYVESGICVLFETDENFIHLSVSLLSVREKYVMERRKGRSIVFCVFSHMQQSRLRTRLAESHRINFKTKPTSQRGDCCLKDKDGKMNIF